MLCVTACGVFVEPSPTPAEMDDVIAALVLRDVTIHTLVSGDAGCPGSGLHGNGVHMEVAIGAQSALWTIYLLRWRRSSDFDAGAQEFADCIAEFEAANPGRTVVQVASNPWRAYGPNWPDPLRTIVSDALHAAGGA
jgi:hypothetical protein